MKCKDILLFPGLACFLIPFVLPPPACTPILCFCSPSLLPSDRPKRDFHCFGRIQSFGKFKLPNQKLRPKLRLMPKLRYFAEASVFLPKLYQKKLKNCTNNTAKVSKMVKRYASASVTSPPKLLLPKLLPNSSAEALAGARFGRSLIQEQDGSY